MKVPGFQHKVSWIDPLVPSCACEASFSCALHVYCTDPSFPFFQFKASPNYERYSHQPVNWEQDTSDAQPQCERPQGSKCIFTA